MDLEEEPEEFYSVLAILSNSWQLNRYTDVENISLFNYSKMASDLQNTLRRWMIMISSKSSNFVTNAKSNSFAAIEHSSVTAPPSSNVGRLSMVVFGINIASLIDHFLSSFTKTRNKAFYFFNEIDII